MRVLIPVAAIAMFLIVGCGSKNQALNYSEQIVKIDRKLGEAVQSDQGRIVQFMTDAVYDSIILLAGSLEKKADESLNEFNALKVPDVKEAGNFKAACLNYFTAVRDIYNSYRVYAEQPNDSLRALEVERMIALEDGIDKVVEDMKEAQKKYADANGFKLR